jgi:plastocyanin
MDGARIMSASVLRRRAMCVATSVLVMIATACGRDDNQETAPATEPALPTTTAPPTTTSPVPAVGTEITIFDFEMSDLTVPPGAQVTVVNKDSEEHTVTSNTPGTFDSKVLGNSQSTFTAPTAPGSYPFHCSHHSSMHGMLVVQ